MATWRRYFSQTPISNELNGYNKPNSEGQMVTAQMRSWLPEVYAGAGNRLDRYNQLEQMDKDSEISASLDTIAEFCTQTEEKTKNPFEFNYNDDASENEVEILKESLKQWMRLNQFNKRLWRIIRSILLYGDQFFIRDPETYKLIWIDPRKVEKIVVNEAQGKKPEIYWVARPDLNLMTLSISPTTDYNNLYGSPGGWIQPTRPPTGSPSSVNTSNTSRFANDSSSLAVDATHIVHMSLSEGLDNNWPFGNSILEPVFKTFKQKELLEDSILIYRVHRAPERRAFYIDTGNMPGHKAMAYVNRIKDEVNQRKIPNKSGSGQNVVDATYNPMSLLEDFYFAVGENGRGSRVEILPGGDNLGTIDDLRYWDNKLKRGLNVPASYISSGPEDSNAPYVDGRATTALIQEYRFSNFCERIQNLINHIFDREFKLYLKYKGVQIDSSLFELTLNKPQNFARYRQIEIDNQRISTFSSIEGIPYISRRIKLKRYLGWSEDEVVENEKAWREENDEETMPSSSADGIVSGDNLRGMGIRPDSGGEDLGVDDFNMGDEGMNNTEDTGESPISGDNDVSGNEDIMPPA